MSSAGNPTVPLHEAVRAASIPAGSRVLVAVSGGADSVALVHAVQRLAFETDHGWLVKIAHINHGLRGSDSDEDERFVREFAARLGVQFEVEAILVREHAAARKLSIETAARELRYAALFRMLDRWLGNVVLTGHNLEDQAETVVSNLLRGAGIAGLSGMAALRDRLVRPFLTISRAQIAQYLENEGLQFREDLSNRDRSYRRNRIRLQLLPVLQTEQPRAQQLIAQTAVTVRQDLDFIESQVERSLPLLGFERTNSTVAFAVDVWRAMHPALKRHALRSIVRKLLGTLDGFHSAHFESMERVLYGLTRSALYTGQMPHGLWLRLSEGVACFGVDRPSAPIGLQPAVLNVPGEADIGSGVCRAEIVEVHRSEEIASWQAVCGPLHALCKGDTCLPALRVRRREPGDRMQPLGLGGTRKIQDLMVDRRIPASMRDAVPLITNDEHIVWVPGVALDARAALPQKGQRVVHLTFTPAQAATMLESLGHFALVRS